jgi:hypothetical protein
MGGSRWTRRSVAVVVASGLLGGLVAADRQVGSGAAPGAPDRLTLTVASSRPGQVTGDDARVVVAVPGGVRTGEVRLIRNGTDVTGLLRPEPGRPSRGRLTGVVAGLRAGRNVLTATAGRGHSATLVVRNHGDRPVFSGPRQYPFVCKTDRNGLGQPIVDNRDRQGLRVFAERGGIRTLQIAGWSRDCAARTKVDYLYRSSDGTFHPLPDPRVTPPDVVATTTLDGRNVPYVVRRERGVINRFVYSIAMLAPPGGGADPDLSGWNGRLLYRFTGGIGVGHDQGVLGEADSLYDPGLSRGYAVAASTGTQTGVHLNLRLSAETALMVKEHFIEEYGIPGYTVGVGGSGGGLQQYIDAEHHPGLIDAAIPQFAFPDAITRITGIGDCEPLERYLDTSKDPAWRTWHNRALVEGLGAGTTARAPGGASVCATGWRGLTQRIFNPAHPPEQPEWAFMDPPGIMRTVRWSHWEDLRSIYGRDAAGFARRTWDNVGVQYGLRALRDGRLRPDRFLDLNAAVGGWKQPADMRPEGCPYRPPGCTANPDPWSSHNQTVRVRTRGSTAAVRAAYETGQVFTGRVSIPIIEWRPYLDALFDIHDAVESFIARQRIVDARGGAGNQVIWFTDARPNMMFDETGRALEVMDEWMTRIRARPERGVAGNRPADAVDHCTDAQGNMIASGPRVWDGILDRRPAGPCTRRFPPRLTPRIAAGGPLADNVVKCRRQPVARAVAAGVYGGWRPTRADVRRLERIFPDGVCDYTGPYPPPGR